MFVLLSMFALHAYRASADELPVVTTEPSSDTVVVSTEPSPTDIVGTITTELISQIAPTIEELPADTTPIVVALAETSSTPVDTNTTASTEVTVATPVTPEVSTEEQDPFTFLMQNMPTPDTTEMVDIANYQPFEVIQPGTKGYLVKQLQSLLGIPQDGVFGPMTQAQLNAVNYHPSGVLKPLSFITLTKVDDTQGLILTNKSVLHIAKDLIVQVIKVFTVGSYNALQSYGFNTPTPAINVGPINNGYGYTGGTPVPPTPSFAHEVTFWQGKVNGHIDGNGVWVTDPDGVSGAEIDHLSYCNKWYPNTVSVQNAGLKTLSFWKNRGNVDYSDGVNDGPYTSLKMTYECIPGTPMPTPIITPVTPGITVSTPAPVITPTSTPAPVVTPVWYGSGGAFQYAAAIAPTIVAPSVVTTTTSDTITEKTPSKITSVAKKTAPKAKHKAIQTKYSKPIRKAIVAETTDQNPAPVTKVTIAPRR